MTNDSDKFRTAAELERLGAYRVAGQRWERGAERWLPLNEGKRSRPIDHRAASVAVNLAEPEQTRHYRADNPGPAREYDWTPNPSFGYPLRTSQ